MILVIYTSSYLLDNYYDLESDILRDPVDALVYQPLSRGELYVTTLKMLSDILTRSLTDMSDDPWVTGFFKELCQEYDWVISRGLNCIHRVKLLSRYTVQLEVYSNA